MAVKTGSVMIDWPRTAVLITGATGSFGQACVSTLLQKYQPKKVVVFSRDELKQHEMKLRFPEYRAIRYFLGDVRDKDRLARAFHGIDIVIHAAALKQVPACEYNPFEAIMTNVMGAKNIVDCAIDSKVQRVIGLSTDKAVSPVNLYGATKLCMEKLLIQANSYSGAGGTRFSCVRYGNVIGSRGRVNPLFASQRSGGTVTVTDRRMTRFWITVPQGVQFVLDCVNRMKGGEILVPKISSMRIVDLAKVIAPGCKVEFTGIRPGEKLHEILVSEDEARHTIEFDDFFVIEPLFREWERQPWSGGKPPRDGFRYGSDLNDRWLSINELASLAREWERTP